MLFSKSLRRWTRRSPTSRVRSPRSHRWAGHPGFERLEDRTLLSVNSWSISGGNPVFETDGLAYFIVNCSLQLPGPVSVEYRTMAGTATADDYTAISGTLTFAPGDSPITLAVAIVDDLLTEESETFSVELFNPTNSEISTAQAPGTVRINDHAPNLDPIANQTVDEHVLLEFYAVGADVDEPAETLTYSLVAGAPAGAMIDASSGQFFWTPQEVHGGGVYEVTVRVTDSGSPNRSTTQTISITVIETNERPTTGGMSDVTVDEDSADTVISVQSSFDDVEDGPTGLSYSISDNSDSSLFSSVSIDSSGQLRLAYALNAYGAATITVRAVDSGGLSVETSFMVIVNAVNDPPVMGAFSMLYDSGFGGWILSGSATDVDDDLTAVAVSFGGILAGLNVSAQLDENGSFTIIQELAGVGVGHASAWVTDAQGAQSNIAQTVV